MDGDGESGEETHAEEFAVGRGIGIGGGDLFHLEVFGGGEGGIGVVEGVGFEFGVNFVGIFGMGNEGVDDADEGEPAEEGGGVDPVAEGIAVVLNEGVGAFGEDFDEGDIEHNASGKTGGNGEKAEVGALGEKGKCATDAGGETCEKRESKGYPDVLHGLKVGRVGEKGKAGLCFFGDDGRASVGKAGAADFAGEAVAAAGGAVFAAVGDDLEME